MVSTVRSRPNHYEVLGLTPAASSAEIARAFASAMSPLRPRAFGGLGAVSVAYETLRDPVKRSAYDVALGLRPAPAVRVPFIAATRRDLPLQAPIAAPQPPERVAEPRTAAFIAASLRGLAERDSPVETTPAARVPQPSAPAAAEPTPRVRSRSAPAADARLPDIATDPIASKRAGAAVALVLAVGVTGAWAGWESANDIEQQVPQRSVTSALPPPKAFPNAIVLPSASANRAEGMPQRAIRAKVAARRIERGPRLTEDAAAGPLHQADTDPLAPAEPETVAVEPASAEASAAPVVAAKLALPDRVIARTIERIGYACGQVASATALDAPGAFKVTCTSGHSYRAAPVRGRYHFRRLGKQ